MVVETWGSLRVRDRQAVAEIEQGSSARVHVMTHGSYPSLMVVSEWHFLVNLARFDLDLIEKIHHLLFRYRSTR